MGGGSYSGDLYAERAKQRAATNAPVFHHDVAVRSGTAKALHERLDPSKLTNGVRESRDSAEHPNSRPVLFGLDVTASMRSVPGVVHTKLPTLMSTILTGGYLADPQVLFAAIGDSHTDRVPLQVGQFESDNRMEEDLTHFYLEGGGGGSGEEGYELFLYFAVHHTSTDAWEKRKQKGYLFMTGDELPYDEVIPGALQRVFGGETRTRGVPLTTVLEEAKERYHVFFIIPSGTMNGSDPHLRQRWTQLLGADHVLLLQDPNQICDLVATTIGLTEGTAKPGAVEAMSPAIKEAVDPVLDASQKAVDSAKTKGRKTARL